MFFAAAFLAVAFLPLPEPPGESEDEGLRFARRFIQPAKGRLRAWRSSEGRISAGDGGVEAGTYHEAAVLLGPWPWLRAKWLRCAVSSKVKGRGPRLSG